MMIFWYVLIFLTGGCIGSFLNVLIMRSVEGENWVRGRSMCEHCGRTLAWFDMIPVLSYLIYRGKSRCCGQSITIQHPIVETMIGFLFVWWFAIGTFFFRLVSHPFSTIQPLFWLIIGIILLGILVADLFYGLIPTLFVTLGVAVVLVYRLILALAGEYRWQDLGLSLAAAGGAWLFFWFLRYITRERGMGDGDVILAFLLGLILGWPKTAVGILASFILGALVAIVMVIFGRKKMKSTLPFGPFMIAGIAVTLMFGEKLMKLMF